MTTDPIADLLVQLKNAQMVKKTKVVLPYSQIKAAILKILLAEKLVASFKIIAVEPHKNLEIVLKYSGFVPAITAFKRLSKPGARVYSGVDKLNRYLRGRGLTIISTSKGLLTAREAKKLKISGEVLFRIN